MGEPAAEGSCNKKPGAICNIFNKSLTVSFPNIKKKAHTQKRGKSRKCRMIFIRRKITGEAHDLVERCPAFQRGLEGKLRAAGWRPVGAESALPLSL